MYLERFMVSGWCRKSQINICFTFNFERTRTEAPKIIMKILTLMCEAAFHLELFVPSLVCHLTISIVFLCYHSCGNRFRFQILNKAFFCYLNENFYTKHYLASLRKVSNYCIDLIHSLGMFVPNFLLLSRHIVQV